MEPDTNSLYMEFIRGKKTHRMDTNKPKILSTKRFSVTLDQEAYILLKEAAYREHRSISGHAEYLISTAIGHKSKPS